MQRAVSALIAMALVVCQTAHAASFDCARATTADEEAVCDDPHLSQLDDRLARAYAAAKTASDAPADVTRMARDFMIARRRCGGDAACIGDAYAAILQRLDAATLAEDAPTTIAEDTPPDHASPSVCVVILGLMRQAVSAGRGDLDGVRLREAAAAFRAKAVALHDGDETETRQMIASTVAFYDHLTQAELTSAARMCLAAVDRDFSDDE